MRFLAVLTVWATGCTFATDFDRAYGGDAEVPDAVPSAKDAAPPAVDTGPAARDMALCPDFCRSVGHCMSDPALCHAFAIAAEEDKENSLGLCTTWCVDTNHGVTREELSHAETPENCPAVVGGLRAGISELDESCDLIVRECERACGDSLDRLFEECVGDQRPCLDACLAQPAAYWECLASSSCAEVCSRYGDGLRECLESLPNCARRCEQGDAEWQRCAAQTVPAREWRHVICDLVRSCVP